jgi:hypothetical protein
MSYEELPQVFNMTIGSPDPVADGTARVWTFKPRSGVMDGTLAKEIANGELAEPWQWVEAFEDEIEAAGLQEAYADALLDITSAIVGVEQYNFWSLIRATPAQRARAFLKVVV